MEFYKAQKTDIFHKTILCVKKNNHNWTSKCSSNNWNYYKRQNNSFGTWRYVTLCTSVFNFLYHLLRFIRYNCCLIKCLIQRQCCVKKIFCFIHIKLFLGVLRLSNPYKVRHFRCTLISQVIFWELKKNMKLPLWYLRIYILRGKVFSYQNFLFSFSCCCWMLSWLWKN